MKEGDYEDDITSLNDSPSNQEELSDKDSGAREDDDQSNLGEPAVKELGVREVGDDVASNQNDQCKTSN